MTSYRKWKKDWKLKYYLGKDSFGNKIYAGDTVELYDPISMSSTWESRIFWNPLDGAFVNSHPSFIKMKMGSRGQSLRYFIESYTIPVYDHPDDEEPAYIQKGYCKLIKPFYQE